MAYVGLGHSHSLLGSIHRGPRAFHPQAEAYFKKALAIDPSIAAAHYGLGAIRMIHDWDWPTAEKEFQEASHLDPDLPTKNLHGFYLAAIGCPGDALPVIQQRTQLGRLAAPGRTEVAMG